MINIPLAKPRTKRREARCISLTHFSKVRAKYSNQRQLIIGVTTSNNSTHLQAQGAHG